jgi:hypothetical protein
LEGNNHNKPELSQVGDQSLCVAIQDDLEDQDSIQETLECILRRRVERKRTNKPKEVFDLLKEVDATDLDRFGRTSESGGTPRAVSMTMSLLSLPDVHAGKLRNYRRFHYACRLGSIPWARKT